MLKIFSTFSKDSIYEMENGKERFVKSTFNGPAFFIERVFGGSKFKYKLFHEKSFKIKIILHKNKTETGVILRGNKNSSEIKNIEDGDIIVISTILDEWHLPKKLSSKTIIYFDIQGYVRKYEKKVVIKTVAPGGNIFCLKGTQNEIDLLPRDALEKQKEKMLIVTRGEKGVDIFYRGKKYNFFNQKIIVKNTVGAGDTFFANFVMKFLEEKDIEKSGEFALKQVEKFLKNKISVSRAIEQ